MTIRHASSCQHKHSPRNGDHHPVPPITARERAECLPNFCRFPRTWYAHYWITYYPGTQTGHVLCAIIRHKNAIYSRMDNDFIDRQGRVKVSGFNLYSEVTIR